MNLSELKDSDLVKLIENRWNSSQTLWDVLNKAYDRNVKYYDCEVDGERVPEYIRRTSVKRHKVRSNRIFTNVEAVINALISNPPKINLIPTRDTPQAKDLAAIQEGYFNKKYDDRNTKETMRKGLRNLYFSRLIVLKPFWNSKINDFDVIAIDPRKIRFGKDSTKEQESEFAIEEVEDSLENLIAKFPDKKKELLNKNGINSWLGDTERKDETKLAVNNLQVTYKEAWIKDYLCIKYDNIILFKGKNPYWDWDGIQITQEQVQSLQADDANYKQILGQPLPVLEGQEQSQNLQTYFYNHFDAPRKPYIFATVLNNENTPIGRTDFIHRS